MAGATGLCYASCRAYLDELGHTGPERRSIWLGIQAAERATLDVWAEQAKAKPQASPPGG